MAEHPSRPGNQVPQRVGHFAFSGQSTQQRLRVASQFSRVSFGPCAVDTSNVAAGSRHGALGTGLDSEAGPVPSHGKQLTPRAPGSFMRGPAAKNNKLTPEKPHPLQQDQLSVFFGTRTGTVLFWGGVLVWASVEDRPIRAAVDPPSESGRARWRARSPGLSISETGFVGDSRFCFVFDFLFCVCAFFCLFVCFCFFFFSPR